MAVTVPGQRNNCGTVLQVKSEAAEMFFSRVRPFLAVKVRTVSEGAYPLVIRWKPKIDKVVDLRGGAVYRRPTFSEFLKHYNIEIVE